MLWSDIMSKVVKIKIIKPETITWNDFGKHIRNMDYVCWKLKNRTITRYHELITKELEWNQNNPDNKMNNDMRLNLYGKKGYQQIIASKIKPDYDDYGIYADTLNGVIKEAIDKYKEKQKDFLNGRCTIPTFKRHQPMYVPGRSIKLLDQNTIQLPIFSRRGSKEHNLKSGLVTFKVASNNNHAQPILNHVLNKNYKICDSHWQFNGKNIYLLLVYKDLNIKQVAVDKEKILGLDLGIAKAVTIQVHDTKKHEFIDGGEITAFRNKINKQRRSKQNQLKYCSKNRHGHGRKRLLKPLQTLEHKIENFKDLTNHRYSRFIVDYAIKNDCGTIQMEDLTHISKNDAFLKTWSYFDLQQKIEYKAKELGLNVRYIKPNYTSQRCNRCGVINKENRTTQDQFKCTSCGHKTHADLNAARNIAMKNIESIINDQLELQNKLKQ